MIIVTVYPTKDSAKHLIHPTHGKISVTGSLWPKDTFTARRLMDGSITTAAPAAAPAAYVAPIVEHE